MTTSHPPSSKFSTFGNSITNECHVSNSVFPIEIKLSLFLRFFALGRTPTNSQIFFTTFRWRFKSVKQLEKNKLWLMSHHGNQIPTGVHFILHWVGNSKVSSALWHQNERDQNTANCQSSSRHMLAHRGTHYVFYQYLTMRNPLKERFFYVYHSISYFMITWLFA